jgi:hypothetical protein
MNLKQADAEYNVLGISKVLRRNIVIGIISIQFVAIAYLGNTILSMQQQMLDVKDKENAQTERVYERLIKHIDVKFDTIYTTVDSVTQRIQVSDSLGKKILKNLNK